jgi:hypothetical protein
MRRKEHFEEQKILNSNGKRKRDLVKTVGHKKTLEEGSQKRLKTGEEPEEEVVIVKVRVKVKSDNKTRRRIIRR